MFMITNMRGTAENQMCSSSSSSCTCSFFSMSLFKHSQLYYVAIVVLSLAFTCFSRSSILSILFSFSAFILSSHLLFNFTKKKPSNTISTTQENVLEFEEVYLEPNKRVAQVGGGQIHDYLLSKSCDTSSETESGDLSSSSDDSDVDWSFRHYVGQTAMYSDDSISDDESLIEIELPGGHYMGAKEEPSFNEEPQFSFGVIDEPIFKFGAKGETKFSKYQSNVPELFQESIFNQEDLMELFADINEMNEEENLIEIDISIGSIKCSRLEIAA